MSLELITKCAFWISVLALGYTYLGYPILVGLMSRFGERTIQRGEIEPPVSIVITAYNEERHLRGKLQNTLSLEYPAEKIEIIVTSDCSSDSTDEIVREFALRGVRLHRQPVRLGKTAAQNEAVRLAQGEIILFSDATTLYQADVLRNIMPNFADPSVGCVAGRLIYVDPTHSNVGQGAKSYWGYESFLKRHESRAGSLIGASGCLYAVRRSAYVPLYNEACSDFIIATKMVEQGLRTVYEPAAVCTEETNTRSDREMRMRVRVITQTYTDLWRHRSMLNPFKTGFYAVQLISHKVLRYLVPVQLLSILATSIVLAQTSMFYALIAGTQILFFLTAALSGLLDHFGVSTKLLTLPRYFLLTNLAALLAVYEFMKGNRYAHWEPIRDDALRLPTASVTVVQGKDR